MASQALIANLKQQIETLQEMNDDDHAEEEQEDDAEDDEEQEQPHSYLFKRLGTHFLHLWITYGLDVVFPFFCFKIFICLL